MHHLSKAARRLPFRFLALAAMALASVALSPRSAQAEAVIVVEADSGRVLFQENATYPWYPASVTKLMTMYVALKAVKEGRMQLDTLLTVSPVAASQAPSKMGFKPGTTVTLENALAMVMVKSANDIAVVVAEGVSGSVEKFADEMNRTAQRLGMTQTNYVNPNGLPAEGHVTSARDMAMLARAIIRDLPEYEYFTHIPAIKFGKRITRNFNSLIGRYPGADGMKTGFICASGFNLVASASRNGRRLITVVLGAPSSQSRAVKAAQLLERGFDQSGLSWLMPATTLAALEPIAAAPPNLRDDMCGPKRKRPASDDDHAAMASGNASSETGDIGFSLFSSTSAQSQKPSDMLALAPAAAEPMVVYTGPKRTGESLTAAVAADEASQAAPKKGKKRAGAQVAAKPNPKAAAKPAVAAAAKPAPKTAAAKPAAQPAAKPSAKPTQAASKNGKPDAKTAAADKPKLATAKPKAAAKGN